MESQAERVLLLVDDEENILRSLRRLFRREGYRILTATGGKEALVLLEAEPVGVIVSDQRMPGMTGSEFLQRVKERYPDTVRIMLSGYTDLESVTESINTGAVFKFLTKPWEDDLLVRHVAEAFRIYELNHENKRLTEELRRANEELEQRVEEKTRALQFNIQALKISQDILEELPIAVFGLAEDEVVVANRRARELFDDRVVLIGEPVELLFPPELLSLCAQADEGGQARGDVMLNGQRWRAECRRNQSSGPHSGLILLLREADDD